MAACRLLPKRGELNTAILVRDQRELEMIIEKPNDGRMRVDQSPAGRLQWRMARLKPEGSTFKFDGILLAFK